jgi:hypothetical protein
MLIFISVLALIAVEVTRWQAGKRSEARPAATP